MSMQRLCNVNSVSNVDDIIHTVEVILCWVGKLLPILRCLTNWQSEHCVHPSSAGD